MDLLARFGREARAASRPRELSGGERQRVALARALAVRPSALLLDEPLAALDPGTRTRAARELGAVLAESEVPAVVVTHDFAEAATLAGDVAVLERGRIVQRGSPRELASRPASAFVADFTGASVLIGTARAGSDGLTVVELQGAGTLVSTDALEGDVAASVQPWEVSLEPRGEPAHGSAQNRLPARVVSLVPLGGRVRVAVAVGESEQLLSVEVTEPAVRDLELAAGTEVVASFKATATRLAPG
jgi:molybdate transport system ATP-binding protein